MEALDPGLFVLLTVFGVKALTSLTAVSSYTYSATNGDTVKKHQWEYRSTASFAGKGCSTWSSSSEVSERKSHRGAFGRDEEAGS